MNRLQKTVLPTGGWRLPLGRFELVTNASNLKIAAYSTVVA